MEIKFLDYHLLNKNLFDEYKSYFSDFLDSGYYILGKNVDSFENNFANYIGAKHCIGTSNGLDSLILIFDAMIKLDLIEKNDEVIVPSNTFIATIIAILNVGLVPVFVEPNLEDYNINVNEIEKKLSNKTKIILPVHLYGRSCRMDKLEEISKYNNLFLIEDAAQSHGAVFKDKKVGNFGYASAFSFYPGKNLGALGDAGSIVTNNEELRNMVFKLRNYGSSQKYVHTEIGYNKRLDEVQSGFLNIKLKFLDSYNEQRKRIANFYLENISNSLIKLPKKPENDDEHVWHLFTIRSANRSKLMQYLERKGIGTLIHYPIAPYDQEYLKSSFDRSLYPLSNQIHDEIVSIPNAHYLTDDELHYIVEKINEFQI